MKPMQERLTTLKPRRRQRVKINLEADALSDWFRDAIDLAD